jgi:predicted nucleic acid-binding protein
MERSVPSTKDEKKMVGLDTGFFVRLLQAHPQAVSLWKRVIDGDPAAVSCLSLFELRRLALRGAVEPGAVDVLIKAISGLCETVWLDRLELTAEGADLAHTIGLPSVDALIVASLLSRQVRAIYTTDGHFERCRAKGIRVVLL